MVATRYDVAARYDEVAPVFKDSGLVVRGMLQILQAIATLEYQAGNLTPNALREEDDATLQDILSRHEPRIKEFSGEAIAAITLMDDVLRHMLLQPPDDSVDLDAHIAEVETIFTPPMDVVGALPHLVFEHFCRFAKEVLQSQEQIRQTQVVMVAGHQGSGKGEVIKVFEENGYHVLSMSQIVREVVAAWGLRSTETMDKIIGGQVFKEYFGPAILVQLGLQQAVRERHTKVVIDGPRILEEAATVQALGGTLIALTTHPQYEQDAKVRRQRIVSRAQIEPARVGDIKNFDNREASEGKRVDSIIQLVPPELRLVNGPNTTLDELKTQVQELIGTIQQPLAS